MAKQSRKREGMMSKVSKNNIYAIKYLFGQGLDAEQISAETKITVNAVQSIIESENLTRPGPPTAKDLMINKTAVKKTNSVAVMTQEASMVNDHNRTKHTQSTKNTDHIFKPFKK